MLSKPAYLFPSLAVASIYCSYYLFVSFLLKKDLFLHVIWIFMYCFAYFKNIFPHSFTSGINVALISIHLAWCVYEVHYMCLYMRYIYRISMHRETQSTHNIFKTLCTEAKDQVWEFWSGWWEIFIQTLAVAAANEHKVCNPHCTKHPNFRRHNAKDWYGKRSRIIHEIFK